MGNDYPATCRYPKLISDHSSGKRVFYPGLSRRKKMLNEPCHEKTCPQGLWPGKIQTGLLSYKNKPESWNFVYSKYRHYTVEAANNKGADQTARMRRLSCVFVDRIWHKQVFSWRGSNIMMVWVILSSCHYFSAGKKTGPIYNSGARHCQSQLLDWLKHTKFESTNVFIYEQTNI